MHAGLLTGDSPQLRPLAMKATFASYSMPSSRPVATTWHSGAWMGVFGQRYQLLSPTRRSMQFVALASSGRTHLTCILPSPSGFRAGTSEVGAPTASTSSMPLPLLFAAFMAESLSMEYSPKPSAFRQQTAATYSTPSSALLMVASRRVAVKVVLPDATSRPVAASTSHFLPLPRSVSCTCEASTGGHACGMLHDTLNLPLSSATSFGGPGAGGFSLIFGTPMVTGKLTSEAAPHPSLFIAATIAS
mmetsp:Transcript_101970/g.288726  ORF Transcript_101970/g.288726 Transcript_101970/m.288726 type:complete len:246 (-) Transcript_101970:314-1051(-)